MSKILVIEDDKEINRLICEYLTENGYEMLSASNGLAGLNVLEQTPDIDLCLLDLMLPMKSGDRVMQSLRGFSDVPVIVLSAKDTVQTKIDLFRLGADDYITKPFGTEELMARIRAVLRSHRYSEKKEGNHVGKFQFQDLMIEYDKRQVLVDGKEIDLTQTEYNILTFLSIHARKVLTYAAIIQAVWGYSDYGSVKKLQVNMKNIRKKMGVTPGEKRYVVNELGVGYRMLAEDEE